MAEDRHLLFGVTSVPRQMLGDQLGLGERVVVGEQHERRFRGKPSRVAVRGEARPRACQPTHEVGTTVADIGDDGVGPFECNRHERGRQEGENRCGIIQELGEPAPRHPRCARRPQQAEAVGDETEEGERD